MSAPQRDRYTFQYAELRQGKAPALALAAVATELVQSFKTSPHYEALLSAIVSRLMESDEVHAGDMVKSLSDSLIARQNAILEDEWKKDKERTKKWTKGPEVVNKIEQESDDDEAELDEETRERLIKERAADDARKEQEWRRNQERFEALQKQKEENEARLREKARHVDVKAFEEKLRSQGAVLLNAGNAKQKKNNKQQQMSPEEMEALTREVAEAVKEKERLKTVLSTSDEELPVQVTQAKEELAKAEAQAKGLSMPTKPLDLNKGQITQLQQKLSKQVMEKNRFALQLKAAEPNSQRDELLELLQKRDALMLVVEANQS